MNILGISGIEGSVPFKRRHWPGLEEREYRISQGHDSAAALVVNGVSVAAAAEVRFTRNKHTGDFPAHAIHCCLSQTGLGLNDVDEIVNAFDYSPYRNLYGLDTVAALRYQDVYSRDALLALVERDCPGFPPDRVRQVGHHLAHAASAYCTSGWDECMVAVIDGMGEVESASVYHAHGGQLDLIQAISARDSIGVLYSLVTLHLGFDFNSDEYKIMGLAPYGDPSRFRHFFEAAVAQNGCGSIKIPILSLNRTRGERENYTATRRYLQQHLVPERRPDDEVRDEHRDVAAALQECLDLAIQHFLGYFGKKLGARRLALAGGVALNCTANGKLIRAGLFDEVYVQPAAGDDGAALGAALLSQPRVGRGAAGALAGAFPRTRPRKR